MPTSYACKGFCSSSGLKATGDPKAMWWHGGFRRLTTWAGGAGRSLEDSGVQALGARAHRNQCSGEGVNREGERGWNTFPKSTNIGKTHTDVHFKIHFKKFLGSFYSTKNNCSGLEKILVKILLWRRPFPTNHLFRSSPSTLKMMRLLAPQGSYYAF